MLHFQIENKQGSQQLDHAAGPIEFGRGPKRDNIARHTITDDVTVSRDHAQIEERAGAIVRVLNVSKGNPIGLADGGLIPPGASRDLALPIRLSLGDTLLSIETGSSDSVRKLAVETITPPPRSRSRADSDERLDSLGTAPSPEKLACWFETVIAVQRAAAGSSEYYGQTARALVDLVGLDSGLVLLRHGQEWEIAARFGKESRLRSDFSYTILRKVVHEQRTFYQSEAPAMPSASLADIEAVVASPIFDAQDQVVGVVYGSRSRGTPTKAPGIGALEAQVVQLLASAVGAGLARQEKEAEAGRLRYQFEQFFSPHLARELQLNPNLLDGQEREVTVLFCDIRGFSRLAEKLGPRDTCRLVSDVMERLTRRIREFEGVVVDYTGDGLMAMWNAPSDQADHAARACRAALGMLAELPNLSTDWQPVCGGPIKLGIGINTGPAMVGNTGSSLKFKYGAMGHTVNLGSRVEGATKQLGVSTLITGSTQALLAKSFATRRLCKVRVVGIAGVVDLYELFAETASPEWVKRRDTYETALQLFEAGQWGDTCRTIYSLLANQGDDYDMPSLNLIARAVECLKSPPSTFDSIQVLTNK